MAVFVGIAQGIQPMVSHNFGLGKVDKLKKTLLYAIILCLVIAVVLYFEVFIFTDSLIAHLILIFNSEDNIILAGLAEIGLHLYFIGSLFCVLRQ